MTERMLSGWLRACALHHSGNCETHDPLVLPKSLEYNYKYMCICIQSLQLCPALCKSCSLCCPMDSSLPDSSVHGILQARILEGIAVPSFRTSSPPGDQTHISCIAGNHYVNRCIGVGEAHIHFIVGVFFIFVSDISIFLDLIIRTGLILVLHQNHHEWPSISFVYSIIIHNK